VSENGTRFLTVLDLRELREHVVAIVRSLPPPDLLARPLHARFRVLSQPKQAAFFDSLKNKFGHTMAKATALWANLNLAPSVPSALRALARNSNAQLIYPIHRTFFCSYVCFWLQRGIVMPMPIKSAVDAARAKILVNFSLDRVPSFDGSRCSRMTPPIYSEHGTGCLFPIRVPLLSLCMSFPFLLGTL